MARPIKKGLAYFPLDSDFLSDRKMQRLLQNHGHTGICTYLTLLCEIYRTNGYYYPYSRDFCLDIAFSLLAHEDNIYKIILYCVEIGLFDMEMFEKHRILTSTGIQSRYRQVHKRKIEFFPPYVLEAKTPIMDPKTPISASITRVFDSETPIMESKTPTKGEGKGKGEGKERKEKNHQKKTLTNEKQLDEDALRREELQRLAAIAAANSPYA